MSNSLLANALSEFRRDPRCSPLPCTILPAYYATVRAGEVLSLSRAVNADALNIHLSEDGFITRAHVTQGVILCYACSMAGRKA
jgi:hypothetical protein